MPHIPQAPHGSTSNTCFFRLWVSPPPRAGTSSQQEREDSKAPRLLLLWAPLLAANPTRSRRPNTDFLPVLPVPLHQGGLRGLVKVRGPLLLMRVSVQSLCRVRLFATSWTAAHQASLSITNSWSSPKLMSIESVAPSNHLILSSPSPVFNLSQHQGLFQ